MLTDVVIVRGVGGGVFNSAEAQNTNSDVRQMFHPHLKI
jgi:hypothetical protein